MKALRKTARVSTHRNEIGFLLDQHIFIDAMRLTQL